MMPRDRYEPLKLNQTNRYAGYQFHARVRVDGMEPAEGFVYLVLSVYRWIRGRVPEEDRGVPEVALPEAEEYASVSLGDFLPYHFSVGYALDITPLMEDGIWSLRLKEPDIGTDERPPVSGRFFTTRVGLRLNEKGYTELGIRIDVTDPASEAKEIDFAFRPGFVRSLAIQPSVCFEQVRELGYGCPLRADTPEEYKKFLYMLDNEENQLPLVVFTHYKPTEKKSAPISMEEFIKNESMKSFLSSPGMGFEMPVKKEIASPSVPVADPILLHDADAFARSTFGYALTVVLGDALFDKFATRIRKDIRPGDIVMCGARKFRGAITVIGFSGEKEKDRKKAYEEALLCAQSYSKHKAPYSFGSVIFEAEARRMAQQLELEKILESGTMEEKEKYAKLVEHVEELNKEINRRDEKITRLEGQCTEEFDRGVAFRDNEIAKQDEEITSLKKELADRQEQIDRMRDSYQQAKVILENAEPMRKTETLPATNEEVVRYFCRMFGDRIDFTNRGMISAYKCDISPANLWEILYTIANDLTDIFREKQGNLTEEDVMNATGFDMSFREGSMTREQKDFMKLRQDVYEGMEISIEPHIKLKAAKGIPAHQRLHFCYIPEFERVVIGYLGDHLDSAATKYAKKR